MAKFASLCLLSYKRPERLRECILSLQENTDYPYELIVNCDGDDDPLNVDWLTDLHRAGAISKLIITGGQNRGVGRSLANCIGVAEGDYIFKVDTDLTFKPRWLSVAIEILDEYPEVGGVSLFNYQNYDPKDSRFKILEMCPTHHIVNDFVSSIYGFRRSSLTMGGWDQDDGFHQNLKRLAITKKDYVVNHGFGVTKSTYVSGTEDHPYKTPTHDKPLLFASKD